ncbi:MAG: FeoB-associated Cys-rich membrane protein [Bacteroidales bacterium]|nr:FeoB-associated Cys-rich membrane protein [Bacteroidales bacterium]
MSNTAQTIIVIVIVTVATVLAGWRIVRNLRNKGGCGCNCSGCPYGGNKCHCSENTPTLPDVDPGEL